MKHSTSKDPQKQQEKESLINETYGVYLDLSEKFLKEREQTIKKIGTSDPDYRGAFERSGTAHGYRQIDQIKRRLLEGEKILHNEKENYRLRTVRPNTLMSSEGGGSIQQLSQRSTHWKTTVWIAALTKASQNLNGMWPLLC